MKNAVNNGAPTSKSRQASTERGSAKMSYSSGSIKISSQNPTFSGVILRALENKPENEDRIPGMA